MKRISVLHIIDSLNMGGSERMVVNLANGMADSIYKPHICVTRQMGTLKTAVAPDIAILDLGRKGLIDIRALRRCFEYVRANNVHLIHAHSTSVFFALLLTFFARDVVVLWHVHRGDGTQYIASYENLFYRWAAHNSKGIACVSTKLKDWVTALKSTDSSIWYLPNFVTCSNAPQSAKPIELPGEKCNRVICISNFRTQKDHFTLLEAWKQVINNFPRAHLILVGAPTEAQYSREVLALIKQPALMERVSWLGERADISALLDQCQIGVLSSRSEGFPVSLLEYGCAKLAAVATDVGQCAEMLDHGNAGLLVPPGDSVALGNALLSILDNDPLRQRLGINLYEHVSKNYSQSAILNRLFDIYAELAPTGSKD